MRFTCLDVARASGLQARKSHGNEIAFVCVNHDDHDPSLLVNEAKDVWMCGPCGAGGTAWQLAAFLAGCHPSEKGSIIAWLRDHDLLD